MTLKTNFCSSPWFHMEIRNSGDFGYCRWANDLSVSNIKQQTPVQFFAKGMANVRTAMLQGHRSPNCDPCSRMEQHHKVSGRQKQLLKTGITVDNFDKSLRSSTYWSAFSHSDKNSGSTDLVPVDWQINLGNHCNSACVFCGPEYSSRLAQEFVKLNLIQTLPGANWSVDHALVEQVVQDIAQTQQLAYLHFIGGETLITPAFKFILEKLIQHQVNDKVAVGFTTNLTTWDQDIVELLTEFKQVHLGMSVECLHSVNDYVRWPSNIDTVKQTMNSWIQHGRQHQWYLSLRTTPTALTVSHLVGLYDFAIEQNIGIESCNFLDSPAFLRMSVLPMQQRHEIAEKLQHWIDVQSVDSVEQIINTRDPNQIRYQLIQDAASYVDYLRTAPDETESLPKLVSYLKLLESNRANSILDYMPEYEHIFRSAGY